jgi:hypothetical protein
MAKRDSQVHASSIKAEINNGAARIVLLSRPQAQN